MSRPRKRFCPHGHDKDAPNGSYWRYIHTLKGTKIRARDCRKCRNINCNKARKRKAKMKISKELYNDLEKFLSKICFTIAYRETKDEAARLLDLLRKGANNEQKGSGS